MPANTRFGDYRSCKNWQNFLCVPGERVKAFETLAADPMPRGCAVGLLQTKMLVFVQDHPNVALIALSKKSDSSCASFWYFLLDGPHPESGLNREEYDKIQRLV